MFTNANDEVVITGQRQGEALFQLNMRPSIEGVDSTNACCIALGALDGLRATIIIWHRRLGHIGYQTLMQMIKEDQTVGLNITGDHNIPRSLCSECELGKFHRQPLKIGRNRASRIGELTHSDIWGPIATLSLGGARYFLVFKDDYSGYATVYFMKKKNEVPALIRLYHALLLNQTGYYMHTLRSDNGKGEYVNQENAKWFAENGIRHETSAPHTPAQNGPSERHMLTTMSSVRCVMIESGLPAKFWGEATSYVTFVKNRVLSRTGKVTPYEYWNNRKPDVTNIRIFGSRAFVRNPLVFSKLDARSQEGVFVGRSHTQNAARIYIPATGKIIISKDVKVDETILYKDVATKDQQLIMVKTFFAFPYIHLIIFFSSLTHSFEISNIYFIPSQSEST